MKTNLSLELLQHFVFYDFGFNNLLQGDNKTSLLVPSQIDLSELALAQLLIYFEPVDYILLGFVAAADLVRPHLIK